MFWKPYADKIRLVKPNDLIRLFYLDERSGSSAKDHSSNARTGTYSGPTLMNALQPSGKNAALFDGINDYIDIISDLNTDWTAGERTQVTVMQWLKKDL